MIGGAAEEIRKLASVCHIERLRTTNGWEVERWTLDKRGRSVLLAAYRSIRAPSDDTPLLETLRSEGLDLERLFLDPVSDDPVMVRATLVEIAAAASVVARSGAPIELLEMPNVPMPSTRFSAQGTDVLAPILDDAYSDVLLEGERLVVCSAKHSVSNAGDLRRKLVASLTTDLELPALSMQVRVLVERLKAQGVDAKRIWYTLVGFPNPDVLSLTGVGAAPPDLNLERQIDRLPDVEEKLYTVRMLIIEDLSELDQEWSP